MDNPNYILIGFHFQGTLALIKPDAFQRRIEIEEIILKEGDRTGICKNFSISWFVEEETSWVDAFIIIFSGFRLVDKKRLRFTRELAEEFYSQHSDKPFFRSDIILW